MAYINIKQISDLVNLRKILQKRFLNEKLGEQEAYQDNVKLFQPIIEPIRKQIATLVPAIQGKIKVPAIQGPAIQGPAMVPAIEETPINVTNLGPLAAKYLSKLGIVKQYDQAFGIKPIDGGIDFKLGSTTVKIDGNNLLIDDKQYPGTEGLWKLLTLKNPGQIMQSDLDIYKDIMFKTKAFLGEDGIVKSNKGEKYIKFIKPIYNEYIMMGELRDTVELRERTGSGIKFISSNPNELINRHRILFLEKNAGNTNVYNELQAINDELLRLKIFDKSIINNFNNFLNKR